MGCLLVDASKRQTWTDGSPDPFPPTQGIQDVEKIRWQLPWSMLAPKGTEYQSFHKGVRMGCCTEMQVVTRKGTG